jgi:putative DNA primase/helicase
VSTVSPVPACAGHVSQDGREDGCSPLLRAALHYAALGWPVVPLHSPDDGEGCSCGRSDCRSVGKHPRTPHGLKDATTDTSTITAWWTTWPTANIGVLTGSESGLLVLDVDPRHDGDKSLADLEREHGSVGSTVVSRTGGGGLHLLFAFPTDGVSIRNRAAIRPGLDVRGDGGYIVAPPSRHASGQCYSWQPAHEPEAVPLAPAPEWLLDIIIGEDKPTTPSPATPVGLTGQILEGARNDTLVSLGGSMRRKGMSGGAIAAALAEENRVRCDPPLPGKEVESIAASVSRYTPASTLVTANLTDLGNAERLLATAGNDVRYVHAWKKWLIWDNTRWVLDNDGEIERRAVWAIRETYVAAAAVEDTKTRRRLVNHARKSESAGRIRAMVSLAANMLGVPVAVDALDANAWLLNCLNGTIDLRTGDLREHHREDLNTKLAPVAYDPAATCSIFDTFLGRIMDGNVELIHFIQKAVGYSLTGDTTEQVLFLLYGTGANGKSTLLEALRAMFGDYGRQTDFTTFLLRSGDSVRNDLARLTGSRFVSAVEVEEGRRLSEAVVKQATGQDTISARFLFNEFFEFSPTFKVFLAANHKPQIRGTDHGIWRRIRLVPFQVCIPDAEQDRDLGKKLRAELSGILAWAVRGCLLLQHEGLTPPAEVCAATRGYREEMDTIGAFLADCCILEAGRTVTASILYLTYEDWCERGHETPLSQREFGRRLRERGLEPGKGSKGTRVWRGLAVVAPAQNGTGGNGWREAEGGVSLGTLPF